MPLSADAKQALIERFNAKLPLRAAALAYARAVLDDQGSPARVAARRLAHQLAGTAASFGWPEISTLGSAVEIADDDALPAALDQLIDAVRAAVVEAEVASRILLVEDDELHADYLEQGLAAPERSFDVAGTAAEARERLEQQDYDLVLLDILLPDADGRSLLTGLQDHPSTADTPVIVLSQVREPTIESECLAYGAEAFFGKGVPLDRLSTALARALARRHEHRATSRHDSLTGLPNRAGLREAFGRMQTQRRASPRVASLALLDVDQFQHILEAGGTPAGDRALERMVAGLRAHLREHDLVGRWGRDEFVVAFPDTPPGAAIERLERVLDHLQDASTPGTEPLSFCAGVIELAPDQTLELAVSRSGRPLYAAKRTGRGRIAAPGQEPTTPRLRILLAEDDDQMAAMVTQLLQEAGLEVDREPDGLAALEAANARRYAAIIVDRGMPRMDGYTLIERLRSDRRHRRVPIVVLTAATTESEIARAFELGADDYVHKPFEPVELVARVQRLARHAGRHHGPD